VHGTHQAVDARDGFCHTRLVFRVRAIFVAGGAAVYRQLPMTVFLSSRASGTRNRAFDLAIAALGVACLAVAIAANQRWLDRHFLPSFFVPHDWYVRAESSARAALAAIGIALTLAAPRIGRVVIRAPGRGASIAAAAMLALVAGEIVLQVAPPRPLGWLVPNDEPRRQPDARLGWVLAPGRVGRTIVAGHTIEYAIDGNGYRVRRLDEPVDRTRPAIVFAGESVMFGEGLSWDETIPAQVATRLSLQPVNLAAVSLAPAGQVQRVALATPSMEMSEADSRALGIAERNSRFHSLFQAGERGEPVSAAVRELWSNGSSASTRGIAADTTAANTQQGAQPLDLFSDRRGVYSG